MDFVTLLLSTLGAWEPATDISCLITCAQRSAQGKQDLLPHSAACDPNTGAPQQIWNHKTEQRRLAGQCGQGPNCLNQAPCNCVTVRPGVSLHCSTWVLWIHVVGMVTPICHLMLSLDFLLIFYCCFQKLYWIYIYCPLLSSQLPSGN